MHEPSSKGARKTAPQSSSFVKKLWVLRELGGWKSEVLVRRYAQMSVQHLRLYSDLLIFGDTKPKGYVSEKSEVPAHTFVHVQSRPHLDLVK